MAKAHFGSDNVSGIAPEIMEAIARANEGGVDSYGGDALTERLNARFGELFEFVKASVLGQVFAISEGVCAVPHDERLLFVVLGICQRFGEQPFAEFNLAEHRHQQARHRHAIEQRCVLGDCLLDPIVSQLHEVEVLGHCRRADEHHARCLVGVDPF